MTCKILDRLCELLGEVQVRSGLVAILRPKGGAWPDEITEFDRQVCAAGLKVFIRAAASDEWPVEVLPPGYKPAAWVLVREIVPGERCRQEATLYSLEQN
jgi:hypothetical protein